MRKNNVKIPGYKYSEDRLYNIWNSMIGRRYREKSDSYKHYGGRGIKVCEEWRNSFLHLRDGRFPLDMIIIFREKSRS